MKKQKVISLDIDYDSDIFVPLTNSFGCEINNRLCFYDIEDGTDNLLPEHWEYIHQKSIILFKRAFDEQEYKNDALIRPYGLNYFKVINNPVEFFAIYLIRQGFLSPRYFQFFLSNIKDWSPADTICKQTNKILFCTRLWEQMDTHFPVDEINETRIRIASFLRKKYRGSVIAGISDSPLSRKLCKDLILPSDFTFRRNFHKLIRKSSVCITTMGLYRSIGWKFGEFVASGKAIVSEPLAFSVPGEFCDGKNYLSFSSLEQLEERCDFLLRHEKERSSMEKNNIDYYFHYLRPDVLVWNTIKYVVDIQNGILE